MYEIIDCERLYTKKTISFYLKHTIASFVPVKEQKCDRGDKKEQQCEYTRVYRTTCCLLQLVGTYVVKQRKRA